MFGCSWVFAFILKKKHFSRQLLAPGYQEIWYSPDGTRQSSSPANTVSLNKQMYFCWGNFKKDCLKIESVTTLTEKCCGFFLKYMMFYGFIGGWSGNRDIFWVRILSSRIIVSTMGRFWAWRDPVWWSALVQDSGEETCFTKRNI